MTAVRFAPLGAVLNSMNALLSGYLVGYSEVKLLEQKIYGVRYCSRD